MLMCYCCIVILCNDQYSTSLHIPVVFVLRTLEARTRFDLSGGIITPEHRVLSMWSTAPIATELTKQDRNYTG